MSAAEGQDAIKFTATHMNMKLPPDQLKTRKGRANVVNLVKTYFDNDGYHIQFNVLDTNILKDAQKHPEKYRDLVVRVAGFSTFFTRLHVGVQNEIVARTEQSFGLGAETRSTGCGVAIRHAAPAFLHPHHKAAAGRRHQKENDLAEEMHDQHRNWSWQLPETDRHPHGADFVPGLNAVVMGAAAAAGKLGWELVGIRDGFDGLLHPERYPEGGLITLSPQLVENLDPAAAGSLGQSARVDPFHVRPSTKTKWLRKWTCRTSAGPAAGGRD